MSQVFGRPEMPDPNEPASALASIPSDDIQIRAEDDGTVVTMEIKANAIVTRHDLPDGSVSFGSVECAEGILEAEFDLTDEGERILEELEDERIIDKLIKHMHKQEHIRERRAVKRKRKMAKQSRKRNRG